MLHLKLVLNWASVCSPNILRTVRRTTIRFLIEFLLRRTLVQTVRRTILRSKLAYNEMQASAPTCAGIEKRSRQHDPKSRLKSSQYTLIISHKVIQLLYHSGSQRQGCARAIPSEASEVLTP